MVGRICLGVLLWMLALPAWAQPDAGLLRELRAGGYVLYFRHASTDLSKNDASMKSYEDCASQRNLTERGREEARAIGEHFRRLRIPVGDVLASPYCRTMETARLAFGRAQATNDVRGGPAQPDNAQRYAGLRKLLSSAVPKGKNRVISSHGNPFYALAGAPYLAEGEMALVRPEGEAFTIVGRIRIEDWSLFP